MSSELNTINTANKLELELEFVDSVSVVGM